MSHADDDLLLAISSLLDKKLEPIKADIADLRAETRNDLELLRNEFRTELALIRADIESINLRIESINLRLENDILPRLQNIEDCYLSTYRRYQASVNQIEAIQADTDILKKVVANHSLILQNMA
ncbi:MAG: hypothetical protein LUE86_13000 [Clostridiales bacterium]|nr:hypothetical protein [Clostridiales bacterium]